MALLYFGPHWMSYWILPISLLISAPVSGQIASWSFECSCANHSFPIDADHTQAGVLAAKARMNGGNNNGSPDVCSGNDTWGTNFWPRVPNREPDSYVEFSVTVDFGHQLRVTGVSFSTSVSSSSAATAFDVYYSLNNWQSEHYLSSGSSSTTCGISGSGLDVTITEGNTFAFRIYPYDQNPAALAATLRFDNVSIIGAAILPVEWGPFSATTAVSGVLLQWQTLAESGNDYFAIERSATGASFEEVARLSGAGTINTKQVYEYLDSNPLPGTSYYRIRQVDWDGSYHFSPIQMVERGFQITDLRLYPNPVVDLLTIDLAGLADTPSTFVLQTLDGHAITTLVIPAGQQRSSWAAGNLPPGVYLVRRQDELGGAVIRVVKL